MKQNFKILYSFVKKSVLNFSQYKVNQFTEQFHLIFMGCFKTTIVLQRGPQL